MLKNNNVYGKRNINRKYYKKDIKKMYYTNWQSLYCTGKGFD